MALLVQHWVLVVVPLKLGLGLPVQELQVESPLVPFVQFVVLAGRRRGVALLVEAGSIASEWLDRQDIPSQTLRALLFGCVGSWSNLRGC